MSMRSSICLGRKRLGRGAPLLMLVPFVAFGLAACSGGKQVVAPPALVVAVPVRADAGTGGTMAIRYPVEVAPRYATPMSFRVPGKLIDRKVRIGDTVKKGEVVAHLDPIDAQKQLASAQAAFDAAEHRLVFAKQQLERDTAQSAQNLIPTNQLEQTQDAFTAARAGREQAAAQLVVARNNLEYNSLVAIHDGVITSENADTGQVVAAGQAVYGLAWSGNTDLTLDAAASDLSRMTIGQAASVTFAALPGRTFQARVREITPAADPQSRTYRVRLTLDQPGHSGTDDSVRLGMTGEATLMPAITEAAKAPTFTVPATAMFHQGNSPAVWVVNPNTSTLDLRQVSVRSYTDHSTVVSGGLKDGDTVVVAGVHTVYAGQRVTPVRPLFDGDGDVAGAAQ
jgi:membrane fusion protein, multidrug efflux system